MSTMLEVAMEHYGFNVERNRPFFKEMFDEFPYPLTSNYCGIFMAYIARNAYPWVGVPNAPEVARRWLSIGEEVKEPVTGDIVVFWREAKNSWKGHVGLFISWKDKQNLYCLGGNQGYDKSINIQLYDKVRVLGYRRVQGEGI
jgi:uncharacterized protein (TIGR02594 family)